MASNLQQISLLIFSLVCLLIAQDPLITPIPPTKLDITEQQDIKDECAPSSSVPLPEGRINGGEAADHAQFPFAVYLFNDDKGSLCAASLISWRHAVTAKHCLNGLKSVKYLQFYVGGICRGPVGPDTAPCENEPYLERLDVHSVFWTNEPGLTEDHAIIQLTDQVPKYLRDRVHFACLPKKHDFVPDSIIALGWGVVQYNTTIISKYLRFARLTTQGISREECEDYTEWHFCAKSPTGPYPLRGIGLGDHGSGGVEEAGLFSNGLRRYVVHGIATNGHGVDGLGILSDYIKTYNLIAFYCKYLDLCEETSS